MDKNGQLKQLFNTTNKLNEDFLGTESITALFNGTISGIGLVVGVLGVVIWACYQLPYIFYSLRKTISDHLLNLAYFLEEHAYEIDTSTEKGKEAQKKQLKIVERLKTWGKMLSIDEEQAQKKAEEEKKEAEEEAREESSENNDNSTSSSSNDDGDILL